ncbi:uncharacterized protein IL334_003015 [Kwoniella shivajii]|uniref:ER membrane protein complex subunit 2 n=1 Tax=Kwoniella shivajii TaxID=564305 RepID=A0ABZ1CWC6_9TREE|nr:hypothetical protein IL334_003015 [Kwoniella shivajii]
MAPRPRQSSGSLQSPSRPPESQIEVLYNTAVQSFVRRDHVKTQAILSRLLDLLRQKAGGQRTLWYELDTIHEIANDQDGYDDWTIKTLKLSISSFASLYTDPPPTLSTLPDVISNLLPPAAPDRVLRYLYSLCEAHSLSPIPALLPPQLVSTLILASLKLRPSSSSLNFAHQLSEEWIAALPDHFIFSISMQSDIKDAKMKRKLESAREGYLKVVELFVGEVLSREGEWEMARGFLDGENVMGSKRKEALFKHVRIIQMTPSQPLPTPSPSSSLVLPSSSVSSSSKSRTASRATRSRSGSASSSSSSSERTARPNQPQLGMQGHKRKAPTKSSDDSKGKGKVMDQSASHVDSSLSSTPTTGGQGSGHIPSRGAMHVESTVKHLINSTLSILPTQWSKRVKSLLNGRMHYILGLPIPFFLLAMFLIRFQRNSTPTTVHGSTASSIDRVKRKLRLARVQQGGLWDWIRFYLRWWTAKFVGIWTLGTTITYV